MTDDEADEEFFKDTQWTEKLAANPVMARRLAGLITMANHKMALIYAKQPKFEEAIYPSDLD